MYFKKLSLNYVLKCENASKCMCSFGNEAVGISWAAHQCFCFLSASISLPCADLCPQRGAVGLVTHVCGHDGVSI